MNGILIRVLVVLAVVLGTAGAQAQQTYPTQSIRLLVPYAPGGVADIVARLVSQRMSETLGQQVIVDNRPSAGGIVATEAVQKAEPDGYTLLWLNSGHAVSVSLFKSLPYDPVKDFAPVSMVGSFGMALMVDKNSPFKTLGELIAFAKANPTRFNIGTASVGSTQYISAELFRSMAGIGVPTVPFKATPMIIAAVKSGDVTAMMEILAPSLPHIRSGTLRALGVSFATRFAGLPDVPAIAEAGVPGYEATAWNAVAAPARTPQAVIERLNREVRAAVAHPELRKRFVELGVEPRAGSPEELAQHLAAEIAKWKKVIDNAKIERQ
jgi:tripartite-type tricarboxylate transporter receptor subunit TctC